MWTGNSRTSEFGEEEEEEEDFESFFDEVSEAEEDCGGGRDGGGAEDALSSIAMSWSELVETRIVKSHSKRCLKRSSIPFSNDLP